MQKELLIFVVLIGVIAGLITMSNSSADVTEKGEIGTSANLVVAAGNDYSININAKDTTDSSFGKNGKSKSQKYLYSENWDDYGVDNCPNEFEDGNGNCFDSNYDGELDKDEKEAKEKGSKDWDADKKNDPNDDDWADCAEDEDGKNLCSGDEGWKPAMGNGKWDEGEGTENSKEWDDGEAIHEVIPGDGYTKELLTFHWYLIEGKKFTGNKKYISLDGTTLDTRNCSVEDFLANQCDPETMWADCGSSYQETVEIPGEKFTDADRNGEYSWGEDFKDCNEDGECVWASDFGRMGGTPGNGMYDGPSSSNESKTWDCGQDYRACHDDNENGTCESWEERISWELEYTGTQEQDLNINLKVLDLGSYHVNGQKEMLVYDTEYTYNITVEEEEGPVVEAKIKYDTSDLSNPRK